MNSDGSIISYLIILFLFVLTFGAAVYMLWNNHSIKKELLRRRYFKNWAFDLAENGGDNPCDNDQKIPACSIYEGNIDIVFSKKEYSYDENR